MPKATASLAQVQIGDTSVAAGETARLELQVARLFTGAWLTLPVSVVNGAHAGARLWLNAAIHGDELNGMEIIRRVLEKLDPGRLHGTVVAVPVVNVFGFVQQSRYLPDRRDLNRSFPGSARGSLASRLAHLFMSEIVSRCEYGVDLHTGSHRRTNLPQIRAHLDDAETRRIAEAFGAPMMYQATEIRGSLRAAARKRGAHLIVYEAGGPLRFDEEAIAIGVRGVLRVMSALDMIPSERASIDEPLPPSFVARSTRWLRASQSGIFYLETNLGRSVVKGERIGRIAAPLSEDIVIVRAPSDGLVIGSTSNPLVHQGDALVHLAQRETRESETAT